MRYHQRIMSLSRTYRPQAFADVTNQKHVKETLQKEVETGNIAHAYLFSGPRGVGKTTIARIFAKALQCESPKQGEPCNACPICVEVNANHLLDIIEMDAASHTGVENVREAIIEHVRFAPVRGKRKVYIIDEVHMLSTSAFNALLKTLEEPPEYAVFILATTEFHKLPATIVSRCQRFDFHRLADADLHERINHLATAEGIRVDADVVMRVARHADGSVRDAETLLTQLFALGEKKITSDVADLVIPASRLPMAATILSACAERSLKQALASIATLADQGIALTPVLDDLIESIRHLLLAADDQVYAKQLAAGDEGERAIAGLVGRYEPQELGDMALLFMERRRDAKQGIDPRFAMELAVTAIAIGVLPHAPAKHGANGPGAALRTVPAPVTEEAVPARTQTEKQPATLERTMMPPVAQGEAVVSLSDVRLAWRAFLDEVGEKSASLKYILTTCSPADVQGDAIIIRFQYQFHRDKIMNDLKSRRIVEDALATVLKGKNVRVDAIIGEDAERAAVRKTDMVSNILKAFGGEVVGETP